MWIIENLNNICVKKIEVNGESIAAIKVDIQKNVLQVITDSSPMFLVINSYKKLTMNEIEESSKIKDVIKYYEMILEGD